LRLKYSTVIPEELAMKPDIGYIENIAGPVIKAGGLPSVCMYEVVRVGKEQLIGEVIEVGAHSCIIQCYEETSGIAPGEPVAATGDTLSVLSLIHI